MFTWAERSSIPDYTYEMIHYRNGMVKEINFVFSDKYNKAVDKKALDEELERLKDQREKTANRIQKDSESHKVWLDLFLEVIRTSNDFTSADLFLKYFNVPNEAINADFYYVMKEQSSPYRQLIEQEAFNTAYEFLHFYPLPDALNEFQTLLKTAISKNNSAGTFYLINCMLNKPYDSLLNDDETRNLLKNEYKSSEKYHRVVEARRIAEVLNDSDRLKRVFALEAMINNNVKDAINYLKEIAAIDEFKPIVQEFYREAIQQGEQSGDIEALKTAYSYAKYGQLSEDGDKKFVQEPAGKLFEYYILKSNVSELDYFEAENYRDDCSDRLIQDAIGKRMLILIQNNNKTIAKHLKQRFNVTFRPGEYGIETEVQKLYKNLTETSGIYNEPKGEENLLTALDVAELFGFPASEKETIKFMLCKFYILNKMYDNAKEYFIPMDSDLIDLITKQIRTLIGTKDYTGAYNLLDTLPVKISRHERAERKNELKQLISKEEEEISLNELGMTILLDDLYSLKILTQSYYIRSFMRGILSGADGVQFLADLHIPFIRHMESCSKIRLNNYIKRLLADDKISAEILHHHYGTYVKPDFLDYLSYMIKRLFGVC